MLICGIYRLLCPHMCIMRVLGFMAGEEVREASGQVVVGIRQASAW